MKYSKESMDGAKYDGIFKALGDEHRLQILRLLAEKELSAGEILSSMDIVQSTLSHHMKVLTDSGVVAATRSGKWTIYSVNMEVVKNAALFLDDFLKEAQHAEKSEIIAKSGRAEGRIAVDLKTEDGKPETGYGEEGNSGMESADADPASVSDGTKADEGGREEEEGHKDRQVSSEKKKGKKGKKSKKNSRK